jgi:hypothetical protein
VHFALVATDMSELRMITAPSPVQYPPYAAADGGKKFSSTRGRLFFVPRTMSALFDLAHEATAIPPFTSPPRLLHIS